jgi:hypothetical protein
MERRETAKDITLSGRVWRLGKLDARSAGYMAMKLMAKIGNVLAGVMTGQVTDPVVIMTAVASGLDSFSKAEYFELQADALSVVREVTNEAGTEMAVLIMTPGGDYGRPGIADDPLLLMSLTVQSIVFNLSPFFDESALKASLAALPFRGSSPFNAQTSTSSSTDR